MSFTGPHFSEVSSVVGLSNPSVNRATLFLKLFHPGDLICDLFEPFTSKSRFIATALVYGVSRVNETHYDFQILVDQNVIYEQRQQALPLQRQYFLIPLSSNDPTYGIGDNYFLNPGTHEFQVFCQDIDIYAWGTLHVTKYTP